MIVAFDYDGTWSADPTVFAAVVAAFRDRGHVCLIVTNRGPTEGAAELARTGLPIIFANHGPKRAAARAVGHEVDVWIDDNPILVDKGAAGIIEIGYEHR